MATRTPATDPGDGRGKRQSVLAELRRLIPKQELSVAELVRTLHELSGGLRALGTLGDGRFRDEVVLNQSAVRVETADIPVPAFTSWDPATRQWVIRIDDGLSRQEWRLTLLHEYARIIWHGHEAALFASLPPAGSHRTEFMEVAAEIFAGHVLVPPGSLRAAWARGMRTVSALAEHFDVTPDVIRWRLGEVDVTHDFDVSELQDS